jgi:DnaJ family protein C protein 17
VEDAKKTLADIVESVEWAEGKEPDIDLPERSGSSPKSSSAADDGTAGPFTPRKPPAEARKQFPGLDSAPSTPFSAKSSKDIGGDGLRKVPSFASFKSASFNTPVNSPFSKSINSPSLEEITMIRLKNAEKKRLEEKIRREEAEIAVKEEGETTG